ncbi:MAG: sulfurtransferase, partial [Ardenticatenaceae bacterium]
ATFMGEPHPEMIASLEEVEDLVSRGEGARLVDARAARRYRGEIEPIDPVAGHIPGARNRPHAHNLTDQGTMRPPDELAAEWKSLLGDLPPEAAISYCGSGVTACHNLLALEHAGLAGARLFIPSWSGWSSDAGRRVETGSAGE